MAEEIIDLRDRIEKMLIQIENEGTEQIDEKISNKIYQETKNSNIKLSMQAKQAIANQSKEKLIENENLKSSENKINKSLNKNETFPAVSLSVKNSSSNKFLIFMFIIQILSNFGILYFLYLGME